MKKREAPNGKIDLRPNYSARLQYLEGLDKVSRPSPLETLSKAVGLRRRHAINIPDKYSHPVDYWLYAGEMNWTAFSKQTETNDVRQALELWQKRYKRACAANWIMDAAVQTVTLAALSKKRQPSEWLYLPTEDERSLFALRFEGEAPWWHPDFEPWPRFAKSIRATFNQQLNDYVAQAIPSPDGTPAVHLSRLRFRRRQRCSVVRSRRDSRPGHIHL
jgi:hypothetical protein